MGPLWAPLRTNNGARVDDKLQPVDMNRIETAYNGGTATLRFWQNHKINNVAWNRRETDCERGTTTLRF
jgi:hypothetical protein